MTETTESAKRDPLEEKVLRASDVKEGVGLSYRQLNDWDSKGVLPSDRKEKGSWRKFTGREAFVLLICKEIRDKFGVPLEKLGYIKSCMLEKEANHLKFAIDYIVNLGVNIYLLTDLKETFIMHTDLEIEDLFRHGFFRGDEEQSYLLININPLVNKLLSLKGLPPLKTSDMVYDQMHKYHEQTTARSNGEAEILKLIRDDKYRQVVIHLKDGKVVRADTEEELSKSEKNKRDKELLALIKGKKYQSIMLKVQDGKIVRLNRSIPIKLNKGTEKS